jgi:hypothetical protein
LIQGSTVLGVSNLTFALIVILFYLLVQGIENYFIVPRVLGDAVKLHPLVVITGVLIGATVGGIIGALLAAPLIASTKEIIAYCINKILGQNPFPEVEIIILEESEYPWSGGLEAINDKVRKYIPGRTSESLEETLDVDEQDLDNIEVEEINE